MYDVYLRLKGETEWLIFTNKPVTKDTAERFRDSIERNYKRVEATISLEGIIP